MKKAFETVYKMRLFKKIKATTTTTKKEDKSYVISKNVQIMVTGHWDKMFIRVSSICSLQRHFLPDDSNLSPNSPEKQIRLSLFC